MGLGGIIKELMDAKKLNAYELANETGISQSSLSRILNSETNKLNLRNMQLLANYFNVSLDYLRTGRRELPLKPDPGGTDILSPDEMLSRLIVTNEKLVEQNAELIRALTLQNTTINKNAETISQLASVANLLGGNVAKKARGGIAL